MAKRYEPSDTEITAVLILEELASAIRAYMHASDEVRGRVLTSIERDEFCRKCKDNLLTFLRLQDEHQARHKKRHRYIRPDRSRASLIVVSASGPSRRIPLLTGLFDP
jgi:hypothetical protein